MPISDIPILSMLRTRMQWHQERQHLLAENVANADTPNYRAATSRRPISTAR
jgi:flagellar basal-body rod protein FlgB